MQTVGIGNIYQFSGFEKQKHFHMEVLYGFFKNYFRTEDQNKAVLMG